VLCCRTDHGRTADINLLDATIKVCARSNSFTEWVKVYDDQLEGLNLEFFQLIEVIWLASISQNTCVHARVQSLHAALEALWESREGFNWSDINAKISNLGGRGICGHNLYACAIKRASELFEPSLVIHAN